MSITHRYAEFISKFDDAPDRFELTVKEVYSQILTPGSTALDLGAHTGKHTIPMARTVGPTGRIYAFEPIPEKFSRLLETLKNESLDQVSAFNVCCSRSNGIVEFTYLPNDPGKSAIFIRKSLESAQIQKIVRPCLSVRLDDFLLSIDNLEFIKMDIEGAEFDAVVGASDLIARTKPIMHMEIGSPSLEAFGTAPQAMFDHLMKSDYEIMDIFGIDLPTTEQFLESVGARGAYDYFAIPTGDARKDRVRGLSEAMWRF
jgi:FkbM family methyltransferase